MKQIQWTELDVTISTQHTKQIHVDNKLFHNLMVRLWKYYQVTINNPHFTFLATLLQRYYPELKERWNNIVDLASQDRRCADVENMTSQFNVATTFSVQNP